MDFVDHEESRASFSHISTTFLKYFENLETSFRL